MSPLREMGRFVFAGIACMGYAMFMIVNVPLPPILL